MNPVRPSEAATLDRQLLAAHGRGDHRALVPLYMLAGDAHEAGNDLRAACFYLTHAYVYALELGMDEASQIHSRLKAYGCEE